MQPYDVQFTDVAIKSLRRLQKQEQRRILAQIRLLAQNPHTKSNVKRLVNFDVTYRLRVGQYRVLYDLEDELRIIDVIDIRHRSRAY